MKTKMLIPLLFCLGILAACAEMNPHPMDMSQAVLNADHEALAKHYDETADQMQVKVDEHKKLLSRYESKAYLYGRQAQDLKTHCYSLINSYEKAVEENRKMAELHRQM